MRDLLFEVASPEITWMTCDVVFFLKVADFLFLGPEFLAKTSLQKPANRQPLWVAFLASFISPIENLQEMDQFGRSFQTLTVRLRVLRQLISKVSKKQPPKVGLGIWEIQGPTEKKHTHTHAYIYIYLDQQTSRKKRLFWSMTLFLANWPILGQIGQFNPNDPKWQKSGWNLIFYVFPWCPNPITSLSFTIATLVALIDPWRVWLDPWGLRFQAWAPALLFLLIFAELVHCSGIGCQLA